jgi:Bacterial regulatory proteins, luxR family
VLSHYPDSRYAARLLEELPERAGHLAHGPHLAGRNMIADALRHIDDGECVIDPTIVSRLVAASAPAPLDVLTGREREVLTLVAEDRSSGAIGEPLSYSRKTVDTHTSHRTCSSSTCARRPSTTGACSRPRLPALRLSLVHAKAHPGPRP